MSRGLLYIVFGKGYDALAAHTIAYSRRHTDLPIRVLTNIPKARRNVVWNRVRNVSFELFEWTDRDNRKLKTSMIDFTPFDETLYLDCDTVIQKEGVEQIFDVVDSNFVLNLLLHWNKGDKVIRLYRDTMLKAGVSLPLDVYNGGMIYFFKCDNARALFDTWQRLWHDMGRGREMPSLACTLQNVKVTQAPKLFFSPEAYDKDSIIQHNYPGFFKKFNLPVIQFNRWFDKDPADWNWVGMP